MYATLTTIKSSHVWLLSATSDIVGECPTSAVYAVIGREGAIVGQTRCLERRIGEYVSALQRPRPRDRSAIAQIKSLQRAFPFCKTLVVLLLERPPVGDLYDCERAWLIAAANAGQSLVTGGEGQITVRPPSWPSSAKRLKAIHDMATRRRWPMEAAQIAIRLNGLSRDSFADWLNTLLRRAA